MGRRTYLTPLPEPRLNVLRGSIDAWLELERERELATESRDYASLDKAADALLFLLDPVRRAKDGATDETRVASTPAGAGAVGWHPMPEFYLAEHDYLPRYSTAEEVAETARALGLVEFNAVLSAHEPALAGAYVHTPLSRPLVEQDRRYLRGRFDTMRAFYETEAERGHAVFVEYS
ncbi:DUF1877 family protein [Rubrivirga sp. IMCC43871]|uniref:DUF1877 family protein n=1 Tax=Rubrivirga sp. IMCC43871 TaxID=3391575 RepID=UPI00398FED09